MVISKSTKIDESKPFFFDRKLSVREAKKNGLEYPTKPVSAPYRPGSTGIGLILGFPYVGISAPKMELLRSVGT